MQYDGNLRDTDINSMVPAKTTRLDWSGLMQNYQNGQYPGQSSICFLPMSDVNLWDLTCIYSTFLFTEYLQTKNVLESPNRSHLINHYIGTLWLWFTVKHKIDPSRQHFTTRRISHAEEFSGMHWICYAPIWYLWSFWNVYVSNTIKQMLMGKSVLRSVRGHMIEDYVFRILLIWTF